MTAVVAPGKLVLTGAYAVLEGAPAIVAAVDWYAVAHVSAPEAVDVRALHDDDGRKLGLGSSAAAMVAAHGARAIGRGADLTAAGVRVELLGEARAAHARAQSGGSGVDVAAAVYGGVLRYELRGPDALVRPSALPAGVVLAAFFSGVSARTSDLIARVERQRERTAKARDVLARVAMEAAAAVDAADGPRLVAAAEAYGSALDALGRAADAPIVPPPFAALAEAARADHGAFLPSGAGGGDVGVWLGLAAPSRAFVTRAEALGMRPLALGVDFHGVRIQPAP